MHYQQFNPSPILADYIKFFWILEYRQEEEAASPEIILPDGCVELIFHYGDRYRRIYDNDTIEVQERSFVIGQFDKFIKIMPTGHTGIIAIRFHPYGIQPFLPVPILELTGRSLGICDLYGSRGEKLEDQVMNAKHNEQRLRLIQEFLLERLAENMETDKLVKECVRCIHQSNGSLHLNKIAGQLNISTRQLERRFVSSVGLSPKVLSRILRFQHIFKLVESKQFNNLTALALEGGYYDQAHFIREFKAISGSNPKHYFNSSHPFTDYFTGS